MTVMMPQRHRAAAKKPMWIIVLLSMVWVVLIGAYVFPPQRYSKCYLFASSVCTPFKDWLPSMGPRERTDEEIISSVVIRDILSMPMPVSKNPKIALMFLTPGSLPFEKLWEKFLQGHEGRYSIYVHASREKPVHTSSLFAGRDIHSDAIVCSFLVRDMGIDWRMGAEWFETCLLDYDPASNYGNWTYGAGVGNDPREDRYFSIPKQAKTYDPEGEYVSYWLPELRSLAKERRNFPGASYIRQIVPLKFDGGNQKKDQQLNRQRRPNNMYRR